MNYKKIYNNIIENRKDNPLCESEYGEWHHIVPRSLGGSDSPDNLVRLTAREHFICHALLAEMYEYKTNEWYKMNLAFKMMWCYSEKNSTRYFNSRLYEYKRKDFSKVMSKSQSGKRNSQYGTMWVYHLVKETSIKIDKSELDDYETRGWEQGRVLDFKKKKESIRKQEQKIIRKQKEKEKRIKEETELFNKFLNSDCESINKFSKRDDVPHTQQSLSQRWRYWIPHLYNTIDTVKSKNA